DLSKEQKQSEVASGKSNDNPQGKPEAITRTGTKIMISSNDHKSQGENSSLTSGNNSENPEVPDSSAPLKKTDAVDLSKDQKQSEVASGKSNDNPQGKPAAITRTGTKIMPSNNDNEPQSEPLNNTLSNELGRLRLQLQYSELTPEDTGYFTDEERNESSESEDKGNENKEADEEQLSSSKLPENNRESSDIPKPPLPFTVGDLTSVKLKKLSTTQESSQGQGGLFGSLLQNIDKAKPFVPHEESNVENGLDDFK
ncbi:MAG: hypothetical protein IJJ04_03805, partial [Clostridia bacterium]|nr:hypothetical protein [Clostridia bacterium]